MGVTIHWDNEKPISTEDKEACIGILKNIAREIGFEFIETKEPGYMCEQITRYMDGREEKYHIFVGSSWHTGAYPQLRMSAIRQGKQEVFSHSIMAHPTGTESFEVAFIPNETHPENRWELLHGFCKTQAFSEDNPYDNARSHMWIIATLMELKQIMPQLEIVDESDFYVEELPFEEMDQNKILESFGENKALVDRIQKELEENGFSAKQGATTVAVTKPEESVKSTGMLEGDTKYTHTVYENREVLYQELLETKKQLVLTIRPKEEKDNEINNTNQE